VYKLEQPKEEIPAQKNRRLERKHVKLILELLLMGIVGFLVFYPFFLFFFNYMT